MDDSTDDTPEVITEAARDCPFPVTVLHRETPEGGLGGAVVEGLKAATSQWIVVMDGDCQHPPSLIPELIASGERANAGLVVASRYIKGGSREGLAGGYRIAVSRGATWLTKSLFPRRLRGISDPMSGFFAIRRSAVTAEVLRPLGYKILLELAVRSRPRQVTEVPFVFQDRFAGESKSSAREGFRFLRHLVGLRTASPVARMVVFGLIGATGFVPNLLGLYALTAAGLHYVPAEILANQLGVAWNFLLIEHLLFRERRKHRSRWDRMGRFALLANADLLLRIPLIALFVDRFDMGALSATALALVTTFVLRFMRHRSAGLSAAPQPRERARRPYREEDRVRFRVRPRRRTSLLAVTGLAAGLLLVSPQPASAVNLVTNPGFETAGTDGMPSCWEKSGWGDNDFTFATVTDAHSGSQAMKVTLTRRVDGDRKALITESAACAPVVTVGKQYDLGLYYKTTTPDAAITLFRHDTTAGWQYWTDLKTLDMAAAWTGATVRTPVVPAGTDRITWGVSVYGTGSATTDDYTMEQVSDPVPCGHLYRHGRGVREREVDGPADPEPGPLHALRRPQQRQGAADRGLGEQRGELRRGNLHVGGLQPGDRLVQGDPHPQGHVLRRARPARRRAGAGDERQQGLPGRGRSRLRGVQGLVRLRPGHRDVRQDQRHERRSLVSVGDRAGQRRHHLVRRSARGLVGFGDRRAVVERPAAVAAAVAGQPDVVVLGPVPVDDPDAGR